MHVLLECQVLSSSQSHTRSRNTLDRRVVCKVHEHNGTVDSAGLGKVLDEEVSFFEGDTDSSEYYSELIVCIEYLCLTSDLCSQFCMRQTGTGEDRQLLTTNQCVQTVDSGNTSLNELVRIYTSSRVHWNTVDIDSLVRNDFRTAINWTSHTGEYTSEHIFGYWQLKTMTEETNLTVTQVDTCGIFEQLNNSVAAVYFQNFTTTDIAAWKFDFTQLIVGDTFYAGYHHQRTCDFSYGAVFF